MSIFEKVKDAICKVQPGVDENRIAEDALLQDDLEIDSLSMVELALALEDSAGFYIPDNELKDVSTVGDIVALLELKLKERNA